MLYDLEQVGLTLQATCPVSVNDKTVSSLEHPSSLFFWESQMWSAVPTLIPICSESGPAECLSWMITVWSSECLEHFNVQFIWQLRGHG